MRQVLIINQKIEEAEEIAHNLGETKAEITCVSSIHEALCQFSRTSAREKRLFLYGIELYRQRQASNKVDTHGACNQGQQKEG